MHFLRSQQPYSILILMFDSEPMIFTQNSPRHDPCHKPRPMRFSTQGNPLAAHEAAVGALAGLFQQPRKIGDRHMSLPLLHNHPVLLKRRHLPADGL